MQLRLFSLTSPFLVSFIMVQERHLLSTEKFHSVSEKNVHQRCFFSGYDFSHNRTLSVNNLFKTTSLPSRLQWNVTGVIKSWLKERFLFKLELFSLIVVLFTGLRRKKGFIAQKFCNFYTSGRVPVFAVERPTYFCNVSTMISHSEMLHDTIFWVASAANTPNFFELSLSHDQSFFELSHDLVELNQKNYKVTSSHWFAGLSQCPVKWNLTFFRGLFC